MFSLPAKSGGNGLPQWCSLLPRDLNLPRLDRKDLLGVLAPVIRRVGVAIRGEWLGQLVIRAGKAIG